jgi:integrase
VPQLQFALLEQEAHQTRHGAGDPAEGGRLTMSGKPEELAAYTGSHRFRQRGMENGTVKKTGKRVKTWTGYYHVYRKQADGTERRDKAKKVLGPVSEMTKGEAEETLRVFIRRRNVLPAAESPAATVATICDDLRLLREGDWDDATRSTNASVLELIKSGLGKRPLETVSAEDLKLFLNALPKRSWKTPKGKVRTGISLSYVKKTITQLRAVFDLALERELIRKNPSRSSTVKLTVPKQARKPDKSIFPPVELPRLMAALNTRDRIIAWISILGATRPNELFPIQGKDVGSNWVNIEKALNRKRETKDTKTCRPRFIYVPPFVMEDLHQWITEHKVGPDDLVFPNRVGRPIARGNFLNRRLRPAAKRAGIATLDVDFQMLRRSFATIAHALGLDLKAIQVQLGHAEPDMSAKEYVQEVDAVRIAQFDRLGQMMRGAIPMPVDVMAKLGSRRVN